MFRISTHARYGPTTTATAIFRDYRSYSFKVASAVTRSLEVLILFFVHCVVHGLDTVDQRRFLVPCPFLHVYYLPPAP